MIPPMRTRSAFTLVELSIVLVILGLLVGGVLAGQGLLKAAALRATAQQFTDIQRQFTQFQDKFSGIPGDFNMASQYFTGVANGNGNGWVETASATGYGVNSPDQGAYDGERAQFFVHISKAGLSPEQYDGSNVPGRGLPAVKIAPTDAIFATGPWDTTGGGNFGIDTWMRSHLYVAMMACNPSQLTPGNSLHNDCGIFSPDEAASIDSKIDDGFPFTGKVIGHYYEGPGTVNCFSGQNYNLASSNKTCNLAFELMH